MNRTKDEQRANRERKIKQRKDLVNATHRTWQQEEQDWCSYKDIKDGYFDNNNTLNACMGAGTAKKTKAKHGHATYRHKGAYGKAIDRTAHDQRQIDSMDDQEMDLEG